MNVDAIVFDFDGVIVDSEPVHEENEIEVLARHGITITRKDTIPLKGLAPQQLFKKIVNDYNLNVTPEELGKELKENFVRLAKEKVELLPGARDVLEFFYKKKRLALVTSSFRFLVDLLLEKHGIKHYFEVMITSEDVINGKPHPEPYQKVIERLKISPDKIVVIEDSINGIISAKKAGCKVIAITGTFPRDVLEKEAVEHVVDGLEELKNII